jgi:rSAM/selenodomain-associated transferase 1
VPSQALIVFMKAPEPGRVKTRLIPALGAEMAAELYRALCEEVLQATVPEAGDYERLVFFAPSDAAEAVRAWLPGLRIFPQSGDDLGARMAAAFARVFERGAERVAIIGTDAPGVSRRTVVGSLDALDQADVVLGPAEDGGYYLMALGRPHPHLFEGVRWSTPAVLQETLSRAAAAGLRARTLPRLGDIDTPDDLRAQWPAVARLLESRPDLKRRIEERLARINAG